ncbi:peptidyl-prolyl cis-trans isomerase CYP23 isoform X2 [Elaeis guineensis]|uniref:Peptidyl-prolyl cis-trans isomerase n=1 Tax=Elaeis guineensis var. tenera TaxID=51953 RepID=A0A6J0PF52_ELAGV|nr:peptidyl-prolyl cis-trans isomerase CYP23 isoform X2 [Elaeis guineensis]
MAASASNAIHRQLTRSERRALFHISLGCESARIIYRGFCAKYQKYNPFFRCTETGVAGTTQKEADEEMAGVGMAIARSGIRCLRLDFVRLLFLLLLVFLSFDRSFSSSEPDMGSARVVFQTSYGDIEFGFFPHVAPKTVEHIFKLVRLGCYNTNHFFRVDKGFVAQVADVVGGRTASMNEEQRLEAEKTIVGEFSSVKHVRGILSMGRYSDPDSASSSFSILLGDAPHLDGEYAIFGRVTKGDDTLKKLEELPTRREGIFVMKIESLLLSPFFSQLSESPYCQHTTMIPELSTVKEKSLF